MNAQSALLVVITAIVVWTISTLFCSSQQAFLASESQALQERFTQTFWSSSFVPATATTMTTTMTMTQRVDDPFQKKSNVGDFIKPKKLWVDTTSEYSGPSRIFPVWNFSNPFPCYQSDTPLLMSTQPASEGLLFQRPEKTGTTTMVGILMRLAHNRAAAMTPKEKKRQNITTTNFKVCKHRAMHGTAVSYKYYQRNRQKSFLFSLIRDPTAKAISRFFHFA
jgi:hypothetical protein